VGTVLTSGIAAFIMNIIKIIFKMAQAGITPHLVFQPQNHRLSSLKCTHSLQYNDNDFLLAICKNASASGGLTSSHILNLKCANNTQLPFVHLVYCVSSPFSTVKWSSWGQLIDEPFTFAPAFQSRELSNSLQEL
jgi:hypothetical protein